MTKADLVVRMAEAAGWPKAATERAALAALLLSRPASAQSIPGAGLNGPPGALSAEAALVVDPEGRVLFAKNAEDERPPASLVKLMTLYLAYEDLERGKLDIEEPVQ